jgi:hypothetical protein
MLLIGFVEGWCLSRINHGSLCIVTFRRVLYYVILIENLEAFVNYIRRDEWQD